MLKEYLSAKVNPKANEKNYILWNDYRVTVLQPRLIRLEKDEKRKFRNVATQSVWFRNMPPQNFTYEKRKDELVIATENCIFHINNDRKKCLVVIDGKKVLMSNRHNLLGTYRTLDMCEGNVIHPKMYDGDQEYSEILQLSNGVCSKSGVAVLDDSSSLSLNENGEIFKDDFCGSDEYIFAFGNNYNDALKALYMITGNTPLVPRYALGNWWSRYYEYTDCEYLALMDKFSRNNIPITIATIDMDWHYALDVDEYFHITELNRNNDFYGGAKGWTGYSWNKRLFPDYKKFLKELKERNLKITLNLHPADGVRWWEDMYEKMADAMGRPKNTLEHIPFDIADTKFINAYFDILHRPYEDDGVDFWWIDWQQGTKSKIDGLDPLWALNHYHYLDNKQNHPIPLILSRYCGIGSHRYPIGFSGDAFVSWKTLKYLPYFTATSSNTGYTWWSHDIGGHMLGDQDNQLYLRSIQYGVFSPVMRLHSGKALSTSKEPWNYCNGCGEIVAKFLRFRHSLIPFLYTNDYLTYKYGKPLVEPLYYKHSEEQAYNYKNEYYFGDLLVSPITSKLKRDGFSKVKTLIPKGRWTDIFTNIIYNIQDNFSEKNLMRRLDSIPVLAKDGTIILFSEDGGNSVSNPENIKVVVYCGNGQFTLYEDDNMENNKSFFTYFVSTITTKSEEKVEKLTISFSGDYQVIPQNRKIKILFNNIENGEIKVFKGEKEMEFKKVYEDCVGVLVPFDKDCKYAIYLKYKNATIVEDIIFNAKKLITTLEDDNLQKANFIEKALKVKCVDDYIAVVDNSNLNKSNKLALKEFV